MIFGQKSMKGALHKGFHLETGSLRPTGFTYELPGKGTSRCHSEENGGYGQLFRDKPENPGSKRNNSRLK